MAPALSQQILDLPLVSEPEWQELIQSPAMVDRIIDHMLSQHGITQDEILLFIGRDWVKEFADGPNYRGVEIRELEQHAILLIPKLDQYGQPQMIKVADKHYLTAKAN
ncbi:MAG TPA: hypothetical protein VNX68_10905 [Nitrosopumilaceae archaeon]|jgi:hypothetical protein|nr:hypothetical protein [Nitrosopumilaceae archaeon]